MSDDEIKQAFRGGDDDGDDTLSVSEAVQAIEQLSGRALDSSTVESGCSDCSIPTHREMDRKFSLSFSFSSFRSGLLRSGLVWTGQRACANAGFYWLLSRRVHLARPAL